MSDSTRLPKCLRGTALRRGYSVGADLSARRTPTVRSSRRPTVSGCGGVDRARHHRCSTGNFSRYYIRGLQGVRFERSDDLYFDAIKLRFAGCFDRMVTSWTPRRSTCCTQAVAPGHLRSVRDVSWFAHRSRRRHEHGLHASTMNANDAPAARNVTTAHRFDASHGGAAATTAASNQRPGRERPRTPAGPGSFDCARRQGQPNHRLPWITPGVLPVELPPVKPKGVHGAWLLSATRSIGRSALATVRGRGVARRKRDRASLFGRQRIQNAHIAGGIAKQQFHRTTPDTHDPSGLFRVRTA